MDQAAPQKRQYVARMSLMAGFALLWSGGIVYRLVDLQILRKEEIRSQVETLHRGFEEIPAQRGEIRDAKGRVLAISQKEPYVFVDPMMLEDPKKTVADLSRILEKDRKWRRRQLARIRQGVEKERSYCRIERRLSERQAREIEALDEDGLYVRHEPWRKYPHGALASHLVGFVGQGGDKEGLEQSLDSLISGKPGQREVLRDGRRRRIGSEGQVLREPQIGANVELTIDANIQYFVEYALERALAETRARNVTAIVMNPHSGALLAMANKPDFDPNRYGKAGYYERKNRAVVDVYEPASAFKIITAAAALDAGLVRPDEVFYCEEGGIQVFDRYIRDNKRYGNLTTAAILWKSSNVGAIKIAQRMKPAVFHDYIDRFGFGQRTGVGLPAETNGIFRDLADWDKVSPSFLSIGHEISVTPLQMLTAASAIANDGLLPKPYLVARVIHPEGQVEDMTPQEPQTRVIRAESARMMRAMLRGVVERGTAKAARLPGVGVFGKTGTAQRLHDGKYAADKFNASFVGFFPADAPRFGVIVVVHHPKGGKVDGGEVAAPIFAEIARRLLLYERAAEPTEQKALAKRMPNWPSKPLPPDIEPGLMPDLRGVGLRNLLFQTHALGIKLNFSGTGRVVEQDPRPGEPIPRDRTCIVRLEEG